MRETVVFIQAPADVAYALSVRGDCQVARSRVRFVVVNVKSVYDFLISLQLDSVSIDYIPYVLLPFPRLPWRVLRVRRRLSKIYKELFANRQCSSVYFFCTQFDAVTPYFIRRLAATAPVLLADHYGMRPRRGQHWPFKVFIRWFYLLLATGVCFDFSEAEQSSIPTWISNFRPEMFGIRMIELQPCSPRLLPTAPWLGRALRPMVLLLDDDHENWPEVAGYGSTILNLLQTLNKRGVCVCLKAHPRSGYSRCLECLDLPTLPAGCPVELLDLGEMTAVIALNSLGLARTAKEGLEAISLLDIVAFRSEEVREWWRRWIDHHSGGRVRYPKSLPELAEMVMQGPLPQDDQAEECEGRSLRQPQ